MTEIFNLDRSQQKSVCFDWKTYGNLMFRHISPATKQSFHQRIFSRSPTDYLTLDEPRKTEWKRERGGGREKRNLINKSLFKNVTVGGGAFERDWGMRAARPAMGSVRSRGREPPPPREGHKRRPSAQQEVSPPKILNLPAPWPWTVQSPELWEIDCCWL